MKIRKVKKLELQQYHNQNRKIRYLELTKIYKNKLNISQQRSRKRMHRNLSIKNRLRTERRDKLVKEIEVNLLANEGKSLGFEREGSELPKQIQLDKNDSKSMFLSIQEISVEKEDSNDPRKVSDGNWYRSQIQKSFDQSRQKQRQKFENLIRMQLQQKNLRAQQIQASQEKKKSANPVIKEQLLKFRRLAELNLDKIKLDQKDKPLTFRGANVMNLSESNIIPEYSTPRATLRDFNVLAGKIYSRQQQRRLGCLNNYNQDSARSINTFRDNLHFMPSSTQYDR
ncbi:UNKNOWN [Stylonychia lemnae]|uniref:Uncharacterized protein n=1 Tax=Stylonychia lemnae TaxID=5949 RepID=A0A077ZTV1_STYLE|nr:UNKNOWN [Stylonychia lemnae]|eukprot:CDW73318.1 UNKNOWN [Stylonychia lemnae]